MIPLSGKLKDSLKKKYKKPQNLPITEQKKPSLSVCRFCSQFEKGPDSVGGNVGKIYWCMTKYFDRVKKRPVTCYRNIKLMENCPKSV